MIDELTVEFSHKCNLNCIHCSSHFIEDNISLDYHYIVYLVNKYKPKSIRWSGGEPFIYLNKELLSIDKNNIKHIVTTNGTMFNEISDLFYLIDELRISIYGDKKFHNSITKNNESFDKIIFLLNNYVNKNNNNFINKIIITSPFWNEKQISDVIKIANNYNLKYRLTSLVPNLDVNFMGNTCSSGNEVCNYNKKMLVLPNKKIIHCASEKRGFRCKYQHEGYI